MVTNGNSVITIGGFNGYTCIRSLYQMTCSPACSWEQMEQTLKDIRCDAVAMLIPDEVSECTESKYSE